MELTQRNFNLEMAFVVARGELVGTARAVVEFKDGNDLCVLRTGLALLAEALAKLDRAREGLDRADESASGTGAAAAAQADARTR